MVDALALEDPAKSFEIEDQAYRLRPIFESWARKDFAAAEKAAKGAKHWQQRYAVEGLAEMKASESPFEEAFAWASAFEVLPEIAMSTVIDRLAKTDLEAALRQLSEAGISKSNHMANTHLALRRLPIEEATDLLARHPTRLFSLFRGLEGLPRDPVEAAGLLGPLAQEIERVDLPNGWHPETEDVSSTLAYLATAPDDAARRALLQDWMAAGARPPGLVKVRNRLLVTSAIDAASLQALRQKYPGRVVLSIPAKLAFGTGEHETTASCLRFLTDEAIERTKRGRPWSLLDLGTGTGILAIAAKALGAEQILGWENDPLALAVAKKNVEAHAFTKNRVRIDFQDVFTWEPSRPAWDVITANMFSGILCTIFPKIRRALKPDGTLIISGILREQAGETLAAASEAGLERTGVKQAGKWVTATFAEAARG